MRGPRGASDVASGHGQLSKGRAIVGQTGAYEGTCAGSLNPARAKDHLNPPPEHNYDIRRHVNIVRLGLQCHAILPVVDSYLGCVGAVKAVKAVGILELRAWFTCTQQFQCELNPRAGSTQRGRDGGNPGAGHAVPCHRIHTHEQQVKSSSTWSR